MALIFQPGYKYFFRQTYTVAILGACFLTTVGYTGKPLAGLNPSSGYLGARKKQSETSVCMSDPKGPDPSTSKSRPKRKVPRAERTLVCFLQSLEGMRLVIELRQDTIVRGLLESVDEEMNLVVTGATYTPLQGEKRDLEWLYVKGTHIRYVHVPSRVDPLRSVEQKKKHIAQLRLMHERELGQLPALKKGSF